MLISSQSQSKQNDKAKHLDNRTQNMRIVPVNFNKEHKAIFLISPYSYFITHTGSVFFIMESQLISGGYIFICQRIALISPL